MKPPSGNHSRHTIEGRKIPKLIDRFVLFLGPNDLQRNMRQYRKAITFSRPLLANYYWKPAHPFFSSLERFQQERRKLGKFRSQIPDYIANLATIATEILEVCPRMPLPIRSEMKSRLLDNFHSGDALFEIGLAWHFIRRKHQVNWLGQTGRRSSEFTVDTGNFEFEVECKRLRIDTARKIKFKDFCNFMDELIPRIEARNLIGRIDINISGRLPSRLDIHRRWADDIVANIPVGHTNRLIKEIGLGSVDFQLQSADNAPVDLSNLWLQMGNRKPNNAIGAIYCGSIDGYPVNPIEITCKSALSDDVLHVMYKTLKGAADHQLSHSSPGVLAMYIPDIHDFHGLEKESGLQRMTYHLFERCDASLSAVIYSSDPTHRLFSGGTDRTTEALVFKNSIGRYPEATNYSFFDELRDA